ncbi:MFS transporter [Streptomyces ureilyticus]|uniref:MFS transporter n=1 Tax=Streptomyces ureilyticus TaxID=1775131 RepID=A0ABX0DXT9_9ACTN|nr:MFS transporter [Streptomyces ureilyticus]NGO43847.1 MFS transporter [Streptomyces ureilyticus]
MSHVPESAHSDPYPHGSYSSAEHPHRWRLLALLCLAQFMLIADVTVINVALPTIGDDLDLGGSGLTWVVTAYTLFFGSLLLLGGRLADAIGKLRSFVAGLTVFTAASIASGLAVSGEMLIAARSAQGIGAALMSPAAMALVTALFHGPDRNKALGVWAAIGGAGSAVGVLLGGVFVSGPGWEWVFFINVPVGLVALFGVPALLVNSRSLVAPSGVGSSLDLVGAFTLTAAPGLLIYGLVRARDHGFDAPGAWLPLIGAVLAAAAFVVVERRVREPLVRLVLFARRSLVGGSVVMLAASGLLIATFFLSSFYVQHVLGFSALKTGLVFLPVAVAITLGAHAASHLVARLGWRPVGVIAFALTAVGAAVLTRLDAGSGVWTDLVPGFALLSLALGTAFVCATTAAMNGMPNEDMGLASGLVSTSHELGAALGVAVISTIAGASLEGGRAGAAAGTGGFDNAFTACAIIAAAVAAVGALLLPAGRPDPTQGPAMAH